MKKINSSIQAVPFYSFYSFNGINTNYGYDSVSNVLSVLHQQGANTLDGATYTYDFAGNRTSKTNRLNGAVSNFSYDNAYQLTGVTGPNPESYTYDPVRNRLTSQTVSNYAYNSSNELTTAGSTTYTYDDSGNTRTKTDGAGTTTYNWDFENRLTSVQLPNSTTVTFKYDPFGRRIQKSGASITNCVYDGADAMEEVDANQNLLAKYSQGTGIDEPLSELRSGAVSYYEQDGLGSVTSLSSIGALANTYAYDSFGNLLSSSGTLTNPYQYTARDYDPETGLRYYRNRYYDAASGRFLSEDPMRFFQATNFYFYVQNNPVNFVDSLGLRPSCLGFWQRVFVFGHGLGNVGIGLAKGTIGFAISAGTDGLATPVGVYLGFQGGVNAIGGLGEMYSAFTGDAEQAHVFSNLAAGGGTISGNIAMGVHALRNPSGLFGETLEVGATVGQFENMTSGFLVAPYAESALEGAAVAGDNFLVHSYDVGSGAVEAIGAVESQYKGGKCCN